MAEYRKFYRRLAMAMQKPVFEVLAWPSSEIRGWWDSDPKSPIGTKRTDIHNQWLCYHMLISGRVKEPSFAKCLYDFDPPPPEVLDHSQLAEKLAKSGWEVTFTGEQNGS